MTAAEAGPRWAIVVHGGAGVIERQRLSAEQERAYREAMRTVTESGARLLSAGKPALDVIEATVGSMEDDPLFNAGRGAVFTEQGRNELDAAIMDGRTLGAGAVAGITRTRHPISLARRVMEASPHVMLVGTGADTFSVQQRLEQVEPGWFYTQRRWDALVKYLQTNQLPVPAKPPGIASDPAPSGLVHDEGKKGTVGVVVLDTAGNVAAGTSTGGTTGKRWGRVGDAPIIGAGTYASNQSCAVSATGTGEYFIRLSVAHEICSLVRYRGMSLQAAADEVIHKQLAALHGDGGIIAVAPDGQMAWSFNTSGMYRARAAEGQPLTIGVFKDEG
ncbi:MAG: isoaspartyl peptidase/L-asparaginase [Pseudomonadota bacterium]|nr:isoaspartyl peptidase/L-asparaginase [Pseudomonadota bacterium]